MRIAFIGLAASLANVGLASTSLCKNITVHVDVSARNGVFSNSLTPQTDIEVANFFLEVTRQGTNFTQQSLQGYNTVSGKYKLETTYCQPSSGAPDVVQLLTHGFGLNRGYWNLAFNNYNYSYSNVAAGQYGFATLSYDRLGIGQSQHGQPLNEIQSWLQIATLETLAGMLRNGSIPGVPKFQKVLSVGHSFGSIQTVAALKQNPSVFDGVALTGYSTQSLYLNFFQLAGDFVEAAPAIKGYPLGYIVGGSPTGLQLNLLAPNEFDPAIIPYIINTGSPSTVGEVLTLTAGSSQDSPPTGFSGPVLVITGQHDLPFCGGNALQKTGRYSNLPAAVKALFPRSMKFKSVIVPNTGHGLNLQYTHPFTYAQINEFFIKNGLGPTKSMAE